MKTLGVRPPIDSPGSHHLLPGSGAGRLDPCRMSGRGFDTIARALVRQVGLARQVGRVEGVAVHRIHLLVSNQNFNA